MSGLRKLIVAAAIISLVGASTSAIAASNTPIASPAATAAGSWSTLSVMTGSNAAIAAIRDDDDDREGGFWHPPFLSLAVILATIGTAVYILIKKDDNNLDFNPVFNTDPPVPVPVLVPVPLSPN